MPMPFKIPVSEILANDDQMPMTLPVCLTPEQSAWVRRQADERGVSPQQMVRYVLNRWMRDSREEMRDLHKETHEQDHSAARNTACNASSTAPSKASPEADATPLKRRSGTTLIHLMRRSLKMARAQAEKEKKVRAQANGEHRREGALREKVLKAVPVRPPAEGVPSHQTPSGQAASSHDRAVRSLFDIARQAAV
jgi:hypothetical protein